MPGKQRRQTLRPTVEQLETRLAPAIVSWTGGAGTLNWGDANNWSNNAVPTSADDVTISKTGIGTINIGSGAYEVRSLNDATASLAIASGASLSLAAVNASSTFGQNVTVNSGASLSVGAGASVLIGPSPSYGGTQTLADNGTLTFGVGDTVTLNATTYYGTTTQVVVSSAGLLNASGTAFNSAIANGGVTQMVVNSGGHLQASNSTFALSRLTLSAGSTDTLQFVSFATQLAINSGASFTISSNEFSSTSASVVASGSSTSTIDLRNNYWGTTDATQIAAKITDHAKDSTRPTVLYNPFLSVRPADIVSANAFVTSVPLPKTSP